MTINDCRRPNDTTTEHCKLSVNISQYQIPDVNRRPRKINDLPGEESLDIIFHYFATITRTFKLSILNLQNLI